MGNQPAHPHLGNSRLAIGTFSAGELSFVNRIPHASRGEWEAQILAAWQRIANLDRPAIAAASVNPPLEQPLKDLVRKITGQGIQWAGRDLDLPIGVETSEPNKTGVDRVLNLAAAFEQMGKACCVVDAGTAITVDCCNDNGDYLGGLSRRASICCSIPCMTKPPACRRAIRDSRGNLRKVDRIGHPQRRLFRHSRHGA